MIVFLKRFLICGGWVFLRNRLMAKISEYCHELVHVNIFTPNLLRNNDKDDKRLNLVVFGSRRGEWGQNSITQRNSE